MSLLFRRACQRDGGLATKAISLSALRLAGPSKKSADRPPGLTKKQAAAKALRKDARKSKSQTSIYDSEKMPLEQALLVLKSVEILRPNNTYELTVKTAMPRGAPVPRGRITLPFEPKAKAKETVLVFADGKDADAAKKAGADVVGGPELIEPVASGKLSATIILCTPSLLRTITPRLGRILGPRGMMPSERRGTVTEDVAGFLRRLHGSAEWKGDKAGTIRTAIGKLHYPIPDVVKNVMSFIGAVKIATNTAGRTNAEQDPNKPRNPITKVIVSSTQGPGITLSNFA